MSHCETEKYFTPALHGNLKANFTNTSNDIETEENASNYRLRLSHDFAEHTHSTLPLPPPSNHVTDDATKFLQGRNVPNPLPAMRPLINPATGFEKDGIVCACPT